MNEEKGEEREEREESEEPQPPRKKRKTEGDDKETPFIVDEFDPYFNQDTQEVERTDDETGWEDDSFYRDPEEFWLDEGMWPWPEPPSKKESRPKAPGEEPRNPL